MRKIVTVLGLAALATLAACTAEKNEDVVVPVETATADVQLNADGSVATPAATEAATEAPAVK